MQARRILLVFAVILLVTAVTASFVPVPEETEREPQGSAAKERVESPRSGGDEDAREVEFGADGAPRTEAVAGGSHVVVTVRASRPGQVELEGLGRLAPVARGTPAVFDLFTDRSGSFDVVYLPTEGESRRLGTLVVERGAEGR